MNSRRRFERPRRSYSRRQVLGMGAAAVAATGVDLVAPDQAAARPGPRLPQAPGQGADALRPPIRPRADWANGLGVKGPLVPEDDVRFLLVHHTASTNDYGPDDVVGQIRGFYDFHTGPEKGWPDVAYNFFIDRFGVIWEGREGSLAGPVRGDATGGSQGFALLCSLIGNHAEVPVTPEQQTSLSQLLAWLAETHAIDTTPAGQRLEPRETKLV
ncbi:MAG: N-acetylmuramoyl-L-alanine amidase, partial [Actinomycetota bacterium]